MTLVPTSYDVPTGLATDRFRLRPLRTSDALAHYDALMTSISHLQGAYYRTPGWPAQDLSYSDNHVHVAWHDKERDLRKSFAFVVMSTNGSGYLGNVYVDPCDKSGIDATVTMWVRESELATGLDARSRPRRAGLDRRRLAVPDRRLPRTRVPPRRMEQTATQRLLRSCHPTR